MPACWCRREWTRNLDWKQHFNVHTDDATTRSQKSPPKLLYANQSIIIQFLKTSINRFNKTGPHQTPAVQQHDLGVQAALSSQPVPEFWCSVAYFELDTQVRTERKFDNRREFPLLNIIFLSLGVGGRNV